jgi:putative transport protein
MALAYPLGKIRMKGFSLGTIAAGVLIATVLSYFGSRFGVMYEVPPFVATLALGLFMYAVGFRVGPSFFDGLKGEGLHYALLTVVVCVSGLGLAIGLAKFFHFQAGNAPGLVAGAMTMSSALGAAHMAITSGAVKIPADLTVKTIEANIAAVYAITYVYGTIGLILIVKYLPRLWGFDPVQAAREYESTRLRKDGTFASAGVGGVFKAFRAVDFRVFQVADSHVVGRTVAAVHAQYPELLIERLLREGKDIPLNNGAVLQAGDHLVIGGTPEKLIADMGAFGLEIDDPDALNIPIEHVEVVVTKKRAAGTSLKALAETFGSKMYLHTYLRAGHEMPFSGDTVIHRGDGLIVTGPVSSVQQLADEVGVAARPSTVTDIFTLSLGLCLGWLIGLITIPAFELSLGVGSSGGLLFSGVLVSTLRERFPIFGNTPTGARQFIEDVGLTIFVIVVGINAGASIAAQFVGSGAVYVFVSGVVVTSMPPLIGWLFGFYVLRLNPALLCGAIAGARNLTAAMKAACEESQSSVPALGYAVPYAISAILLTLWGYVAMLV